MVFRLVRIAWFSCLLLFGMWNGRLLAQTQTGGLTGMVTDPSGAVVGKAAVRLTDANGGSHDTTSNKEGIYEFKALAPGVYALKAVAKGFALFTQEQVQITAGQVTQVNVNLVIQVEEEKVEVTDSSTKVDVDPANNAGMVVLKGKDLDALSDDPDELQAELQALAGPSAGPNGGQMYIDGFTAGQLPPKASIREIRINQNPFSAEYDKLGYGRIEIFTKPGTDAFHGQFSINGNTEAFNSRNPFEGTGPAPSYYSTQYGANLSGPISKKASFFFNLERRNLNELSVVDTPFLDPQTLQITQFSGAFPNPRARTNVSQRFDYQVTPNNTLTGRYQYWRNSETGNGVGGFSLASMADNALSTEHTVQITDTQVLSPRIINETRFQFVREVSNQTPLSTAPTISVQGAFSTGGSTSGTYHDTQNRFELHNITYITMGKHALKFGGRFRSTTDDNASDARFNGVYTFGSRANPGATIPCAMVVPSGTSVLSGIQAYQITVNCQAQGVVMSTIIANGGGASFYSLNSSATGTAAASISWQDGSVFAQDDWRVRTNVTVSAGLRFETQNNLGDHADFAPRLGLAWAVDGGGKKSPKTVVRAGYGIFYDRFTADLVLQQELQNGVIQQQFLVQNPSFFNPNTFTPVQGSGGPPQVVYQVNPNLRTPYIMQTGVTLERQLTKYANLSVTYLNSRGVHQFYTNFLNPGQQPAAPIEYQYASGATFKQNQLIVNSSVRMGSKLSLFGYYTLNYANSDTSGAGYIPSVPCVTGAQTPCGIAEDYGRAAFDVRHRVFFGGSIGLPWAMRLSPFLIASSGAPFNIVTGQPSPYGDAAFNIRPTTGTCTAGATGVAHTAYGCFNLVTSPGQEVIPINYATGPGRFVFNLRWSKTFGFGEKKEAASNQGPNGPGTATFGRGPGGGGGPRGGGGGGGGERGGVMFGGGAAANSRYNLTLSVNARNIFNNVNVANPVGNLSSPLFGESNGLAGQPYSSATANRRIDLQLMFNF